MKATSAERLAMAEAEAQNGARLVQRKLDAVAPCLSPQQLAKYRGRLKQNVADLQETVRSLKEQVEVASACE